jgi:stage II sporulation SpoAA-like protein
MTGHHATSQQPPPAAAAPQPGSIAISHPLWPIVQVRYQGDVTAEMFEAASLRFVELVEQAMAEGRGVAWLTDLSSYNPATPLLRQGLAKVIIRYRDQIGRGTLAEARVTQSAVVRGILTAIAWLAPQPWPIRVFESESEAIAWLRGCLEAKAR